MPSVDEAPEVPEADQLYEVEPDGFVAARAALVKDLKAQGRKADADVVGALRRPTPGAFALNQVARHQRDLVEGALAAAEALQRATDEAMAGDAKALRTAQQDQRRNADALVKAGLAVLRERGLRAADEVRQRMLDTVRAAAADDEVAALLRQGRLRTDHEAPGFAIGGFDLGAFASSPRPAAPKARAKADPKAAAKAGKARADRVDEELEATRAELRQALAAREEEASRRGEEATSAAEAAKEAAAAHEQAAIRAEEARRAADEAAQQAWMAEEASAAAAERSATASTAADEARAAVEAATAELDSLG